MVEFYAFRPAAKPLSVSFRCIQLYCAACHAELGKWTSDPGPTVCERCGPTHPGFPTVEAHLGERTTADTVAPPAPVAEPEAETPAP